MPSYTARYFNEVEDQEPAREIPIAASSAEEALAQADQQMLDHEKRVQIDELADDGSKNTAVWAHPKDRD